MLRKLCVLAAGLTLIAGVAVAQEGDHSHDKKEKAAAAKEKGEATAAAAKEKGEAKAATAKEEGEAKAAAAAPAKKKPMQDATVSLASLAVCRSVEDRKPIGEADSFGSDVGQLSCFTWVETTNSPTQVYHRWYVGDQLVNEIPINVRAARWRCWSTKTIRPGWSGPCRVEVVTEEGDVVGSQEFTLTASAQ